MPIISTLFCAVALFFLYLTKEIKYSAKPKSIDTSSPEPMLELPLILQAVESFSRTATALSLRAQSFQEKLIDYAEAEENDEDYQTFDTSGDPDPMPKLPLIRRVVETFTVRAQFVKEKLIDSAEAEAEENDEDYQIDDTYDDAASIPSDESFSRTATALSMRTPSLEEKLFDYAEAEDIEDAQMESIKSKHPIHSPAASVHFAAQPVESQPTTEPEPTPAQAPKEDEPRAAVMLSKNAEAMNAMLAENDIAAESKAEAKKYKRPRSARFTKFLFRKRNQKTTPAIL
jgi:hypothetical protein